jgi:crossover junction endodeoxyribonuclease RuvC
VKVFGIDPGSSRTGYGCVQSDGRRHRLVDCGAISIPSSKSFPEKLKVIHAELSTLIGRHRPDIVAIENLFHAANARSALSRRTVGKAASDLPAEARWVKVRSSRGP